MSTEITPFEALLQIVDAAGSQSKLAAALGVSSTAAWKWVQSSKRLPAEYVLTAERLYGVSRHDLRPDIYPRDYPPAGKLGRKRRDSHRLCEAAK
ncbi:MAG: hypothetical protein B7Y53_08580 [Halothiobacillus sp. 28-55-5]|nr:MAG: hypothetical protein B7Y53_08580 [Halothiobacillus sp. 28-55-5]